MNHTENYQLTQWEKSDRIMMDDFNDNNRKIDEALSAIQEKVDVLWKALPDIGMYLGQLGIQSWLEHGKWLSHRFIRCMTFKGQNYTVVSGNAAVVDGVLRLSGKNAVSTVNSGSYGVGKYNWTRAWAHVRISAGTVRLKLNGQEMQYLGNQFSTSHDGKSCFEFVFYSEGPGSGSMQTTLELDTKNDSTMDVLDYSLFFC